MKKKKHGGKRKNAGRKPIDDKKIRVLLFVNESKIEAKGGMEQIKQYLHECIG